jgi:hypothetical protein
MEKEEKPQFNNYLDKIRERAKKSRVHSRHQMIGLMVAEALGDKTHLALYMKMAREGSNGERMLYMAKSIAENSKINNKGAYFMRLWQLEREKLKPEKKKPVETPKSTTKKKANGTRNGKKRKPKDTEAQSA